jgi:septal ring factor EnvC (AmiA/AmiB activator)
MVLDKGQLVEFDTPKNLLQNDNSLFARLVDQTGPQTAKYLRDIAFGRAKLFDNLPQSKTKATKKSKRSSAKKKSKKRQTKKANNENNRNLDSPNSEKNDSEQTNETKRREETKISSSNPQ